MKAGRTHLMDAVPVTLGQEFGGYAAQVRQGRDRVADATKRLGQLPLGGTATGTGLNTHAEFAERVRARLSADTGLPLSAPADPFEAQGARDGLVEVSGALKVVAVSLTKIANDIAWLGSGPRCGLGEIFLPELQKGSSIMPGKVNPVIPEVVMQVSAQVIGNDAAITIGGLQGNFELNVRIPLLARNLLGSIHLLTTTSRLFADKCVVGHRAQPRGPVEPRRGHPGRGDGAQPVHRLRQGDGDREGRHGVRPPAARGRARARRRGVRPRRGAQPPRDRGGQLGEVTRRYPAADGSSAAGAPTARRSLATWPPITGPATIRATPTHQGAASKASDTIPIRGR